MGLNGIGREPEWARGTPLSIEPRARERPRIKPGTAVFNVPLNFRTHRETLSMMNAYAAIWCCLVLTILNALSIGISALRARARREFLPPPPSGPGVTIIPCLRNRQFFAKRLWRQASGSITLSMN